MRVTQKNYLERQKVKNLRSSLRKQPTFGDATTGFLKLVGAGCRRHRLPAIKHFSVSLSFLKSKDRGGKTAFDPSRGLFGGHLRFVGSIARICKKSVMPLPDNSSELATAPLTCMTRSSTVKFIGVEWYGVCRPTSHFGSVANASGWNRNCFCRVEEVYHLLRSLKLALIHFIEDFLHCKVRSFF